MEADRRRDGARRNIVRSAEGRKEVVERLFVGQVDHRQTRAPLVLVAVEDIVVSDRDVEEIARRDARRIVVVVLRARRGNADQSVEPYCDAGQRPVGLIGVVGVA